MRGKTMGGSAKGGGSGSLRVGSSRPLVRESAARSRFRLCNYRANPARLSQIANTLVPHS